MSNKTIRAIKTEDLKEKLADTRQELMNLRFQIETGQQTDTSRLKITRRLVAQYETILHERELGIHLEADKAAEKAAEKEAKKAAEKEDKKATEKEEKKSVKKEVKKTVEGESKPIARKESRKPAEKANKKAAEKEGTK
jgi:large subunit ribosomal protein L29